MLNKTVWLVLSLSLLLLPHLVIATPPTPPCDEKIEDKEVYENVVLTNDVIKRINDELELSRINIGDCFVGEKVQIRLYYTLPQNFSSYGIIYSDDLTISYSKNGSIELGYYREDGTLDYNKVIGTFKNGVLEIENNTRVQEFIHKLNPKTGSLIQTNERISSGHGWIEYSQYSKSVRGYLLPNSIEWNEFPEIKKSHEIIEKNLLINELSNCSIGKGRGHSYTTTRFHDNENGPWYLTVALICDGRWKDVSFHLNPDGSYERLNVASYHNEKPTTQALLKNQNYWIFLFIAIVIYVVLFLVKRKH